MLEVTMRILPSGIGSSACLKSSGGDGQKVDPSPPPSPRGNAGRGVVTARIWAAGSARREIVRLANAPSPRLAGRGRGVRGSMESCAQTSNVCGCVERVHGGRNANHKIPTQCIRLLPCIHTVPRGQYITFKSTGIHQSILQESKLGPCQDFC